MIKAMFAPETLAYLLSPEVAPLMQNFILLAVILGMFTFVEIQQVLLDRKYTPANSNDEGGDHAHNTSKF